MINRVVLTVSDVTSCKREVEVLAKGVYFVPLVVSYITIFHSGREYYCGSVCISWKYPHSVDIIRTHTAAVGHGTSTRYSTLSTAPYCPM